MTNEKVEMLEVVDENDVVVAIESRDKIHTDGLRHREVHVIFVTPEKEILFQHRAKNKSSYPDKFDSTVGGHVEPGESYLHAGLREGREETGINLKEEDLVYAGAVRSSIFEPNTHVTNNVIRICFGYLYSGKIEDLKVEEGKSLGFAKYKFSDLENLPPEEKEKFIPERLGRTYLDIYDTIFKKLEI